MRNDGGGPGRPGPKRTRSGGTGAEPAIVPSRKVPFEFSLVERCEIFVASLTVAGALCWLAVRCVVVRRRGCYSAFPAIIASGTSHHAKAAARMVRGVQVSWRHYEEVPQFRAIIRCGASLASHSCPDYNDAIWRNARSITGR